MPQQLAQKLLGSVAIVFSPLAGGVLATAHASLEDQLVLHVSMECTSCEEYGSRDVVSQYKART